MGLGFKLLRLWYEDLVPIVLRVPDLGMSVRRRLS